MCRFKEPEYIEAEDKHFVACHLYNEEIMSNLDEYSAEYRRIEEQRRLAEIEERQRKGRKSAKAEHKD